MSFYDNRRITFHKKGGADLHESRCLANNIIAVIAPKSKALKAINKEIERVREKRRLEFVSKKFEKVLTSKKERV